MFGTCKVCLEKDKRISDLQLQVEDLRRLVFPKYDPNLSDLKDEYNEIVDATLHAPDLDQSAIESETSALLSGNYDNFNVEVI